MRSPIPARPERSRSARRSPIQGAPSRRAPRDDPALRVIAETEPVDSARGERDHVLRRGGQLDADDVRVHIDAEDQGIQLLLKPFRQRHVLARDHRGGGEAVPDLLGKVRPGEHGNGAIAEQRRAGSTRRVSNSEAQNGTVSGRPVATSAKARLGTREDGESAPASGASRGTPRRPIRRTSGR
jgi:hypothetical protein